MRDSLQQLLHVFDRFLVFDRGLNLNTFCFTICAYDQGCVFHHRRKKHVRMFIHICVCVCVCMHICIICLCGQADVGQSSYGICGRVYKGM